VFFTLLAITSVSLKNTLLAITSVSVKQDSTPMTPASAKRETARYHIRTLQEGLYLLHHISERQVRLCALSHPQAQTKAIRAITSVSAKKGPAPYYISVSVKQESATTSV